MNEPPPAAMTTTLARKAVPASVAASKPPSTRLERIDALTEVEHRAERLDLLHEAVSEFLAGDHRKRRNVVNWLFGVKLGALSARTVENVHQMRFDVQKP